MQTSTKCHLDPGAKRHSLDMARRVRRHYRSSAAAGFEKASMARASRRAARRALRIEMAI